MKASEVKALKPEELEETLVGLKKDLFFLRMQHATNQLDNPLKIQQVKKDIARVITVIRQNQLAQAGGQNV
jgi:large subunit ribosomal protein L29